MADQSIDLIEVKISIPAYKKESGIRYKWAPNFNIMTRIEDGAIVVKANKEGLISLANHLLNLAQDEMPSGCHMHFDQHNSLNDGSVELIVEKE
jgi:hypothetical protein